ncbi:MAG TPA: c-type cytochrome [Kiloniellales bacterium]|jgi:cytochrome c
MEKGIPMKLRIHTVIFVLPTILVFFAQASGATAAGDADRGKKAFLKCVVCHSATPNVHKTGPSLAGIWGHNAGTAEGFDRYSDAIKASDIVWTDEMLDTWLRDPHALVPGTTMNFRGIENASERQDVVAYLKRLASGAESGSAAHSDDGMAADPTDLSKVPPDNQVTALRYCRDTYQVTTATGDIHKFWEFNLRFKTDSSAKGPPKGRPVMVGSGMQGDRASLVFATPAEISAFVDEKC